MPSVNTITLVFETQDGVKLNPISFKVKDGYSSYETWVQLPGNEGKSEQDFIDYLRYTIPVLQSLGQSTEGVMSQKASTDEFAKKTDKTTKVNGKALDKDIVLKAADVNALPDTGGKVTGLVEIAFNGDGPKLVLHRPDSNDNVAMEFRSKDMSRWFGLGSDGQLYLNATPDINDADGAMIYTTKNRPSAGDLNAYTKTETDAKIKAATDPKFNKGDVDQATGTSTTKVMSQKATTDALNQKADKSTKVNGKPLSGDVQLAPGDVGTYSKEEIDSKLATNVGNAVAKADVVQETGTSTTKIMSQKATTDQLNTKVDKTIKVNGKGLDANVNLVAGDVNAYTKQETNTELDKKLDRIQLKDAEGQSPTDIMSQRAVTESLAGKVPTTRKVNGKPLTTDISLNSGDVGSYSKEETNVELAKKVDKTSVTQSTGTSTTQIPSQKLVTDQLATKVPTSRKVNGKALTADVTLIAGDVGAHTKAEVDGKVSVLVPKTAVTQVTGTSTTNIMSQKAVSDNLNTKVDNTNGIYGGLQRNIFKTKHVGQANPPLVIRTPFDLTKTFSINLEFEGTGILGDTLDYSRVLVEISTMYGTPYLKATPVTTCSPADADRPPYIPMVKDNHLIIMFPEHGQDVDVQINAFVNSYVVGNEVDRIPDLTQNWTLEQLDEEWQPGDALTGLVETPYFKANNYAEDINHLCLTEISGWYSVGGDTEGFPYTDGGLLQVIGTERGVNAMQFALGTNIGEYAYRISNGLTYGNWVDLPTSVTMPTIQSLGGLSATEIRDNFNGRQQWVTKIKTGTWSQLAKIYGDQGPSTYLLTVQHMRDSHAVATQVAITVGDISDRTADIVQISGSADPEFPVSLRLEKDSNNPGAVVISLLDEMGIAGITERYGVELWGSGQRVVYSNHIPGNDANTLVTLPINRYNGLAGNGGGITGIRAIKGDSFNVGVYNSWVELCEFDIRPQTTTMIVDLIGGYSYGDDKANQNAKAQIVLRAVNVPYNKPMGTIWYTSKDNHPVAEFGWLAVGGSTTRYRLFVKIQGTPVSMVVNIRSTDDITVINNKVSAEPAGLIKGHQHEYFTTLKPPTAGEVGTYTKAEIDTMIQSTGGAAVAKTDILQTTGTGTDKLMSQKATTDQLNTKVPTSRKINGKTLSADVSLVAGDVNAYTKAETDTALGKKFDKTGGVVTGGVTAETLTTKGALVWEHAADTGGTLIQLNATSQTGDAAKALINWGEGNNALRFVKGSTPTSNVTDVYGQLKENNVRVYSPSNKPSPSDIGSYTKAEVDSRIDTRVPTTRTVNGKALSADITLAAVDVGAYTKGEVDTKVGTVVPKTAVVQATGTSTTNIMSQKATTDQLATKVPTTRKVNGKPLTADVTLSAADMDLYTKTEIDNELNRKFDKLSVVSGEGQAVDKVMHQKAVSDALISKVPTSRKVNGKSLTSDITITPTDLSVYTKAETDSKLGTKVNTSSVVQGVGASTTNILSQKAVTDALALKVPTTRRINNKLLNADVTLVAGDVGAFKADGITSAVSNQDAVQWNTASGVYQAATAEASAMVVHFRGAGSCPAAQLRFHYNTGGMFYRSARDSYGFESSWAEIYTSASKPSPADIGTYSKAEIDAKLNARVPTSRKVNGKALTSDITLVPGDMNAYTKAEVDGAVVAVKEDLAVLVGARLATHHVTDYVKSLFLIAPSAKAYQTKYGKPLNHYAGTVKIRMTRYGGTPREGRIDLVFHNGYAQDLLHGDRFGSHYYNWKFVKVQYEGETWIALVTGDNPQSTTLTVDGRVFSTSSPSYESVTNEFDSLFFKRFDLVKRAPDSDPIYYNQAMLDSIELLEKGDIDTNMGGLYTAMGDRYLDTSLTSYIGEPDRVPMLDNGGDLTVNTVRPVIANDTKALPTTAALPFRLDNGENNHLLFTTNRDQVKSWLGMTVSDIDTYTKAEVDSRINTRVPTSRKVNGKVLSSDISLSATDVGAYTKAEVDTKVGTLVPKTTTVNGKPLSANVTITLAELGGVSSSGEVNSAVKLKTPRAINGTAFDGTANITTSSWGTSRNLVIGDATKSVNGGANVVWTLAEIGAVSTTDSRLTDSREWTASTMSQAEAEAGTATSRRAVTALRMRQAIAAYAYSKTESNTQAGLKVDKATKVNGKALTADVTLVAGDVGAYTKAEVDSRINTRVPTTRKINGKVLSADVTLIAGDVGAYTKAEVDTKVGTVVPKTAVVQTTGTSTTNIMSQKATTDALNGKVPTSRKVNGKALSADVTLSAADVQALSDDLPFVPGGTDWDTLDQNKTYNVYNSAGQEPWVNAAPGAVFGILEVIGLSGTTRTFAKQVYTDKGNAAIWFRVRNDGHKAWTGWKQVYTTAYKPSPSDIGAYTKAEVDSKVSGATGTALQKSDLATTVGTSTTTAMTQKATTDQLNTKVPTARKVNGKALTGDITLSSADVGTYTKAEIDTKVNGRVPTTRKVNGKVLSADVTLSAADVGAYAKAEVDTKFNGLHQTWKFTAVGGETTLTPGFAFTKCILTVDGYFQPEGYSYTVNSNVITLGSALEAGDLVELIVL